MKTRQPVKNYEKVAKKFAKLYNCDPAVYAEMRELYYWYGWPPWRIAKYLKRVYGIEINRKRVWHWVNKQVC